MSRDITNRAEKSEASDHMDCSGVIPEIISASRLKMQDKEFAAALALIDSVYETINPIDRIPLTGLKADCFQALGDSDEAIASYQSILKADPGAPDWVHIGYANVLERQGKNDTATEQMLLALKKEFSMELVERAVKLSRYTAAPKNTYKNIVEISLAQESVDVATNVGEYLISEGHTDYGCMLFEEVDLPAGGERVGLIEKMVMACVRSGESQVASEQIEKWQSENPGDNRLDEAKNFCQESRILDNVQGVPCFTLSADQSFDEFEILINGYRIRNGFTRYARKLDVQQRETQGTEIRRYLLVLPSCYVDTNKDNFLLTVREINGQKREYSGSYSSRKLFEDDRELYPGDFEYLGDNRIHGWYSSKVDKLDKLAIYLNNSFVDDIDVSLERQDVAEKLEKQPVNCGFDYSWDKDLVVESLELRNTVTGLPVLGTPVKIQRMEDAVKQLEDSITETESVQGNKINSESLVRIFECLRSQPKLSIEYDNSTFKFNRNLPEGISVIIPVYNGLDDVKRCLASLLSSQGSVAHEIICINDCSPDKEVGIYLSEVEKTSGRVTLIQSEVNRGFVKTVNKGLMARAFRDVVLLNSDTITPDGFIDRLHQVSNQNSQYGVITPLSNNATIFSFPLTLEENSLREHGELNEIDNFLKNNAKDEIFEVPTGHGYCMFVKGDVLEKVGCLNEEEWGVGYGEENDYCQRVKMHGWKIGAYYGMYVGHVGSVSFGDEKRETQISKNLKRLNQLYPEYDQLIQKHIHCEGESRLARNKLQLLKHRHDSSSSDVLFVTHTLGGGTTEYLNRCVSSLSKEGIQSIFLSTENKNIVICDADKTLNCVYRFSELDELRDHLKILHLRDVILNSTFNFPAKVFEKIAEVISQYTVVLHDYSWICPRINLIDASGSYCGVPSSDVCVKCIEVGGTHESFNGNWKNINIGLDLWLTKNKTLLDGARTIIAPSNDTAQRMKAKYPDLDIQVKYHMDTFDLNESVVRYKADSIEEQVIGIFGMIGDHKGMQELKQLCWLFSKRHPGIRVLFFGAMSEKKWMEGYSNVSCVGEYTKDSLGKLIREYKPTLGLFMSKWPETYCYAVTDAVSNGVYPIALDVGAFPERIAQHNYGATIPFTSDVEALYEATLNVVSCEDFKNATVGSIQNGASYDLFSEDYFDIEREIEVVQKKMDAA